MLMNPVTPQKRVCSLFLPQEFVLTPVIVPRPAQFQSSSQAPAPNQLCIVGIISGLASSLVIHTFTSLSISGVASTPS